MAKIPFNPRTVEEHRNRYPHALAEDVDPSDIRVGAQSPPAQRAACCFDFHDGMRLVISKERLPALGLHLSASIEDDSALNRDADQGVITFEQFLNLALSRFANISGETRRPKFLGLSAAGRFPHWLLFLEEPQGGTDGG